MDLLLLQLQLFSNTKMILRKGSQALQIYKESITIVIYGSNRQLIQTDIDSPLYVAYTENYHSKNYSLTLQLLKDTYNATISNFLCLLIRLELSKLCSNSDSVQ